MCRSAKENGGFFFEANNPAKRFLHVFFCSSIFLRIFAPVMRFTTNHNKVYAGLQRNFDFSASFNAYYLVNPNNLLTHTHTHLAHLAFKRLRVRAREARVTLINKGFLGVPFVRIFVSLYEQKMNEIRGQNVGTHGSCVPTCAKHTRKAKQKNIYPIN